jgi:hypothetical protein
MSDESKPQATQPSEMELLRAEMRAGFQTVGTRLDGIDSRLVGHDKRFDAIDTRLDGHDKRFDTMDARITTTDARITSTAEDTRRHMDVVAEGLQESFKGVIDQTAALGKKVDRLIASNAIEHSAFQEFVTDHEVRITRLEGTAGQNPQPPATGHQT